MIAVPRPRDTIESAAPSSSISTVAAGPPTVPARLWSRNLRLSVGPKPREEMGGGRDPCTPPEGRTVGRVIATAARPRS
ncbi:hypothetical protein ACWD9K_00890 [Streptomyces sp. 900116325]